MAVHQLAEKTEPPNNCCGHDFSIGMVCRICYSGRYQHPDHCTAAKQVVPAPKPDAVAATIEVRSSVYGDPYLSFQNIGLAWEGVMRNHYQGLFDKIPLGQLFTPDLTADMMTAFKVVRTARPVHHPDNQMDTQAYSRFSEDFHRREYNDTED